MRLDKKTRWISFFTRATSAIIICCILLCIPAFASTYTASFMGEVKSVYRTCLTIARVLAVVSVAGAGLKILFANGEKQAYERTIESAKRQMFISVGALIALYLIPAFIEMGADIGRGIEYHPPTGTTSASGAGRY